MTERDNAAKSPEDIAELKQRLRDTYSDEFSVTSESQPQLKQKKPKRVHCITRAMAEDFSREQVLFSSIIETIFYIIFVCTCCIYVTSLKNPEMFYMTEAIKRGLLNKEFSTDDSDGISYDAIATISDMWLFITGVFVHTVYYDKYFNKYSKAEEERPLSILYDNLVLGVPRIRQVRVADDSCQIHPYFQRLFKRCYAPFDSSSEDKEPFGLGNDIPWLYSDETVTENIAFMGNIAYYTGGGYYLDLSSDGNTTITKLNDLVDNLWITRNSRAVFLEFSLYNTNLNIFSICKLIFEIPPTGGVLTSYKFNCVKLVYNYDEWGYFVFACEIIFYAFIFIYLVQSFRELLYFKMRYFLRFWSFIDCTITVLAMCTFVLSFLKGQNVEAYITKIKENPDKYGNLEYISYLQSLHDDISAVVLFFVFIRFFKYLNFNRTMGQLNDTLKKCAFDVIGFSIMFFIIFFAYAELGYLLFGEQVEGFRTFGHSMFTLLRTILGDFDYEAIEAAHRVLAPIYFLTYIFLVFFVLLNMFLAIINDTYADVKTEIAIAPTQLQMTDYLKLHLGRLLGKFKLFKFKGVERKKSDYNLTAEEIRAALEKCGFSYLEIEMFFARYNINPLAIVTEHDIGQLIAELGHMKPAARTEEGGTGDAEVKKNTEELLLQKQQLKDVETAMFQLAAKVDELIQKLEQIGAKKVLDDAKSDSQASSL